METIIALATLFFGIAFAMIGMTFVYDFFIAPFFDKD